MTITRNFKLCLNAGTQNAPYINVNQYDEGEQWIFDLYTEGGQKFTPSTGAIIGIKSDGNAILNSGTVNSDGQVVITETQQMTAASGLAVFELLIEGETHGTANFIVNVERRPSDDAEFSDSDLSMLQEAIDSVAEIEDLLGGQDVPTVITPIISDWLDDNITNPSNPPIDTSLTVAGAAADAKATGDEIADLKSALNTSETANLFDGVFDTDKAWNCWTATVYKQTSSGYWCGEFDIPEGTTHISANNYWANNSFTAYVGDNYAKIGLVRDYAVSGVNYVYTVPSGAKKVCLSSNLTVTSLGVVFISSSTSIYNKSIAEYPYKGTKLYYADALKLSALNGATLGALLPPISADIAKAIKSTSTIYGKSDLPDFDNAPNNSLITALIPASTAPEDLPAHYPASHVIKGVGHLTTYISSNGVIKIQTYWSAVQGLTYTRQYTTGTGWQSWRAMNLKKRYTCLKNGSGDFSSLVDAINTVCEEMDAELFVGAGTWDIVSELGSDYMNAVSSDSSTWGLVLKNRIHIICSSNSLITAKYTGSNTNVKTYFSAFNAGEYGFTLENANIETDNVRYTVHDDRGGGGGEGYCNRYINCSMKHTNGMYTDCIGGGLGTNGMIEILNCYFEGDANATRLAYYHGNNFIGQTDAQCKLIVKGNYFAGLGTFGLTKYGDSTKVSTAYVSDNSVGSALFVNSGSYAPQDNMRMIEWNNIVRS